MARPYRLVTMSEFGTLNTVSDGSTIADNEFTIAKNINITPAKTIKKRLGLERLNGVGGTSIGSVIGALSSIRLLCRQKTGATDRFFFTDNAKTWVCDTSANNTIEVLVGGAAVANVTWAQQGFNGNVYLLRSTGAIISVAPGVTAGVAVGNVQGTVYTFFKDRQFISNTGAAVPLDSRLTYSQILDNSAATGFPGTNFIDVSPGDGQYISALAVYNDQLVIFKNKSTYVLSADGSPSTWTLRQLHANIGCVGRGTPIVIEGLLYFLSEEGVFRTDGVTFDEISKPIAATIGNLVWNAPTSNTVDAAYWDNKYLFYYPTTNDAYVFDTNNEVWTQWSFTFPARLRGMVVATDLANNYLYAGSEQDNTLWRIGSPTVYTDNSLEYEVRFRLKRTDYGKPVEFKRHFFTDVEMVTKFGTDVDLQISYLVDQNYPLLTSIRTTSPDLAREMMRFSGVGQHRFQEKTFISTGTGDIEIFSITDAIQLREGTHDGP